MLLLIELYYEIYFISNSMNLEKNIKEIILLYSNELCVCQGRLRNYLKL